MSAPAKAYRISADGYRKFYQKHRSLIRALDARLTDENKLVFAGVEFLRRLRDNAADLVSERADNGGPDGPPHIERARGEYDDAFILNEDDPYRAMLFIIDAIIEFRNYPEKQPGLGNYVKRFNIPLV